MASTASSFAASSDENEFFVRKDFRYSLRIILKYPDYVDTNDVGDFFLEFLKSKDDSIESLEDPRLAK
jgi:hypothetical protein